MQTNSLPVSVPTLTPEENSILAVKYAGLPIAKLAPLEMVAMPKALLLKIATITGWVIPEGVFWEMLVDQFRQLLTEKYSLCNPAEIEYAFRMLGTTVKDWGKNIHLALIDEVMIPYMNRRAEISKQEGAYKLAKLQIKHKEDTTDAGMEKWLLETKVQNLAVEFLPVMLYDWLVEKKRLAPTKNEKWEQLQIAIAYTHQKLSTLFTNEMSAINRNALSRFLKMKENGFPKEEADKLYSLTKKMFLYNYLKTYDGTNKTGPVPTADERSEENPN